MKLTKVLLLAAFVLAACACRDEYGYTIRDHTIIYNTPARPAGQQSMLGFACDPIETVRIGIIGLGDRGKYVPRRMPYIEHASVVALCDPIPERIEGAQQSLEKRGAPRAIHEFSGEDGWKQLCELDDIDLVYLAVPWQLHTRMAVYAMEHGKHVAVEVPAATSIQECWALVNTSERTRRHCMMLENCCYDFFELTCLNMAQQGVFGDIVHVEGAYIHNLAPWWDKYQGDWRMTYNKDHHGDVYPTHGIGPVCQVLGIHRGDRMEQLISMDSGAFSGQAKADARHGEGAVNYANGDLTSTLIRTHNGKTILVEHDVVTPRPYSRMYQIVGTEGYASKYPIPSLALGSDAVEVLSSDDLDAEKFMSEESRDSVLNAYKVPFAREIEALARKVGGHGGMDFIMEYRLIYCLHNGLPLDQDVYDAAEWSSLVELTEMSITHGSMPVRMPDFTRGEWNRLDGLKFAY
ncbi:MAG: Gfo/Idh/MocA family oxidoreductase [Bacteroidales bacterium]|nr:Gfo/Idh/MocA family oxidoreductase [Bacteroidales bacterium]